MPELVNGVVIAQVTDNNDPEGAGRIEVTFPWLDDAEPRWLPVASAMAGAGRGLFVMPEPGDEVLVAFEHGNFDHGYVVGFLWSPKNQPPTTSPDDRTFVSREGHKLQFLDSAGTGGNHGALVIMDAHGNAIVMTNGVIGISTPGILRINAATVTIQDRVVNPLGSVI
jgi:uncharacterized protein involved in type VI secretion and phage assembly